jgi:hypothetical protein
MAHTEFGFQVIQRFLTDIAPFGHPDFEPKLIGKGINVMISPLPRNKRARNPRQEGEGAAPGLNAAGVGSAARLTSAPAGVAAVKSKTANSVAAKPPSSAFANNPFAKLDLSVREDAAQESHAES